MDTSIGIRHAVIRSALCLALLVAALSFSASASDYYSTATSDKAKVELSKGVQEFVDKLAAGNGKPIYELTPQAARQVLIDLQSGNVTKPAVDVQDMTLAVGPTGSVDLRVVRPRNANGVLPGIFYIHGGGWILGNKETHDRLVRELAVGVGAAVIYPNYTPSPEAKFPTALEQCYAVMEYVAANPGEFDIDGSKFVIVGDSVGGNMATVLAMIAAERGSPNIVFQALLYPVTDARMGSKSYNDYAEGPWLTKKSMAWFWNAYLPEGEKGLNKYASPLLATEGDLAKLPPALVITDQNDVLRDEGEAYARKLDHAGVPVQGVRINGTMHDFLMLDGLADTGPTRAGMTLTIAEIRRAFGMDT